MRLEQILKSPVVDRVKGAIDFFRAPKSINTLGSFLGADISMKIVNDIRKCSGVLIDDPAYAVFKSKGHPL